MKKGALINFTKFTGKHLCQSVFFNKVTGLRAATLLNKKLWHKFLPVNFCEIFTTASDFICGVFFILFIIKIFRLEKSRFVRKKSTSGKPALKRRKVRTPIFTYFTNF